MVFPFKSDKSTTTIVMPAEGPSLGVAPSGICKWIVFFLKYSTSFMLCFSAYARTQLIAMAADSFITSPICPVKLKPSFPGMLSASKSSVSPPILVHASPIAVPGRSAFLRLSSSVKTGLPKYFSISVLSGISGFASSLFNSFCASFSSSPIRRLSSFCFLTLRPVSGTSFVSSFVFSAA